MKIAITLLFVALIGMPCYGEAVDAYLLIGQSNACGRAYVHEFSDTSLAEPFDDNIHFAWHELSWREPYQVLGDLPLGPIQPHSTDLYAPNGEDMVGPEFTLGRNLASLGNHTLLLSFVSGGTKIINYLPESNNLYQPMLAYVNEQVANMHALGYTEVNWKGLFVVTGESDCRYQNWLVDDRLLIIQESLENDLGVSSLPMAFSLLKGNWVDVPPDEYSKFNYGASIINNEVSALASTDPDIAVTVSNADLDTRYTSGDSTFDGIHYSADAYATLGDRLFSAYLELAYMGDVNLDGFVNEEDASILASNWSPRRATWEMGDFNGDNFVDDIDATLMAANWDTTMKSIPGDANMDGAVNETDAGIVALNMSLDEATWEMGDFNGDGLVNDIDATLLAANWDTPHKSIPGDANMDGAVNELDAHILASNWSPRRATREMGDFNGDGFVDDIDAALLAINWGKTSEVPEPHVIISLMTGVVILLMFSRKRLV